MGNGVRRRNDGLLQWLRAAAMAAATYGGLAAMGFRPQWGAVLLGVVAGLATLGSPDLGVIVAVLAFALPITAANPVVGIAFAVLGIVGVRYLGADGARGFLLVAAAVAGAFYGPVWAAVAIAGYLMGSGAAAFAAGFACLVVEVVAVALGPSVRLAALVESGGTALVDFASQPSSMFAAKWVGAAFSSIDAKMVEGVMSGITSIQRPIAFVVQPLIWAAAAAVTSSLVAQARQRGNQPLLYGAVVSGVAIAAIGAAVLPPAIGLAADWTTLGVAFLTSAVAAIAFAALFETAFAVVPPAPKPAVARTPSMAAEDADVDELLRLVATCEEKLATQHTTVKTVMITDMKSFSRMTEEDGSIVTAKAIQQHRDLLLPVIEANRGHGKSTGGDGLVAAFDEPADALAAAVAMQRALAAHNGAHPGGREMAVRIGVAHGEVVLDKGGRPFIGAALNLAARVMNLADGGQAFATAEVARLAGKGFSVHTHGEYSLKNIANPVEVVEVLWHEEQTAQEPKDDQSE